MKTVLVFVSTLDGKITKWETNEVRTWSSKEDQDYFDEIWNATRVIIMGRETYLSDPLPPHSKHLYIVMTRQPEKFKSDEIPGLIEFTRESPGQLIARFKKEDAKMILIVGGAKIATAFLQEELIDELWLTIEPKIFGKGTGFVVGEKLDINLKLISCNKANSRGTLITKYRVVRSQ
jgi:dihydrofolate reductase